MARSTAQLVPEQASYAPGEPVALVYRVQLAAEGAEFRGVAYFGSGDLELTGTVTIQDRLLGTEAPSMDGYTFGEDPQSPGRWIGTPA